MELICLKREDLYFLVDEVVQVLKERHNIEEDLWISGNEAMRMLGVKSRTTLSKLRNEGKIRFSQPERKIILYYRQSILAYLERNTHEPFSK